MHDFTAIDFETAQGARWSACAIGLVHFKDGEPCFEYESIIRPPENKFHPINIQIHGITPDQTENAREFPDIWMEIQRYIVCQTVVAHNVNFDKDVLFKTLSYYNLPTPNLHCECTYSIWNYRLNEICEAFDIPLQHHSALSDAKACGQLYINHILNKQPLKPIKQAAATDNYRYHEHIGGDVLRPNLEGADPQNFFYGKKIVITGVFENYERNQLANKLKLQGADIDTSVTKRTNFVIVGRDPGYKKMEMINTLNQQGHGIQIIDEDRLNELLH
ncbi:MAG: exonuclease domain-containing protein [Bacteroidales bacterium]